MLASRQDFQGRGEADQGENEHEPDREDQEPPRRQSTYDEEPEPELRVEHQDVAVVEQGVNCANDEEHCQPSEVGGGDAEAPCVGALQLHREAEAEQHGEQSP